MKKYVSVYKIENNSLESFLAYNNRRICRIIANMIYFINTQNYNNNNDKRE